MKDTVITADVKRRELWTLLACFVVANVVNWVAIIKFATPWYEVFSQIGYVVAYSLSGLLADGMGSWLHIGVGRGAATVIMASGVLLSVIALGIYPIKAVRELEFTERSNT